MLSQWLYNIITVNRKRVGKQMDLEFVLDKMGNIFLQRIGLSSGFVILKNLIQRIIS